MMKAKNNIYSILNRYIKSKRFLRHIGLGIETRNNTKYLFVYNFSRGKRIAITKIFSAMALDQDLKNILEEWQIAELRDFVPDRYKPYFK